MSLNKIQIIVGIVSAFVGAIASALVFAFWFGGTFQEVRDLSRRVSALEAANGSQAGATRKGDLCMRLIEAQAVEADKGASSDPERKRQLDYQIAKMQCFDAVPAVDLSSQEK